MQKQSINNTIMPKRKTIPAKIRQEVFKRDNYKCKTCGKSPATDSELSLEVDHILPYSKGGTNDIENLHTLCNRCNKGKGNDESFNITVKDKIYALLDRINPEILKQISMTGTAKVVANDADYQELARLNGLYNCFKIDIIPNSFYGYHAGYNMGTYTVIDNHGNKINFLIQIKIHE